MTGEYLGCSLFCVFFFQAEDGIRDLTVTGVQTCALPISTLTLALSPDESLLLDRARAIAAASVEDFSVLGGTGEPRDGGYRYQLAFLGYGQIGRASCRERV